MSNVFNEKVISNFRDLLILNNNQVGEIEYTEGNYDNDNNLIKEKVVTITTDFCEIGLYDNNLYFVFVIFSKSFNNIFFDRIKDFQNMKIYDFIDFKKDLYPSENFVYSDFLKRINENKYLQIQFDFDDLDLEKLLDSYQKIKEIFIKNNIEVVNQLEIDLIDEKRKIIEKN